MDTSYNSPTSSKEVTEETPNTTHDFPSVKETWDQVCSELQLELSDAAFSTWIQLNPLTDLQPLDDHTVKAIITCPTAFHAGQLKRNFSGILTEKIEKVTGYRIVVEFKVGDFFQSPTMKSRGADGALTHHNLKKPNNFPQSPRVEDLFSPSTVAHNQVNRSAYMAQQAGLRKDFTFETFAVSTTNEMAHAAATAVSQRPGTAYNPLFLYGGVGVGKTHLMHAIGNNIVKNDANSSVIYTTGEEFTNQIVRAIRTKRTIDFKEKFRSAKVFLIDDIQFIAGKDAVQEEFFHTFNAIIQMSGQIILTSDRPPHEIQLLEDRLQSRFEAGLTIDIQQPSFELRTAIVLIKSKAKNLNVPMDLSQHIASQVESARKIEGIITKILSAVELRNRTIDQELIDEVLSSETKQEHTKLRVKPNEVIRAVANHYHIKQTMIKGKRRQQEVVHARHIAMYLLHNDLGISLVETGRWFSNRDHTSVIHARRKVDDLIKTNDSILQDVSAIRMSLKAISK